MENDGYPLVMTNSLRTGQGPSRNSEFSQLQMVDLSMAILDYQRVPSLVNTSTKTIWEITIKIIGKSTISMGHCFNSYVTKYQRVFVRYHPKQISLKEVQLI